MRSDRKFPIGAEVFKGAGVDFRVWAPRARTVAIELYSGKDRTAQFETLASEGNGYHSGTVAAAGPDTLYRIRIDHGSFPDPASRFQPDGPHGPSQVIDPEFEWTDANWQGRAANELVIYELHLGTFTRGGTWR